MTLNLYMYAILAAVAMGVLTGTYFKGRSDGIDTQRGRQAVYIEKARQARQVRQLSKAETIARLRAANTRLQGEVRREIREIPVYAECKHPDDIMQHIQSALTGGSRPADSGELSGVDAPGR